MIIAIGGSYGSGGKRLAIHLSEILGYTLCDDVIAEEIMKDSDIDMPIENIKFFDESIGSAPVSAMEKLSMINKGGFIGAINTLSRDVIPLDRRMEDLQKKIVFSFADKGNCVLLGRCAGYYLNDREDTLSLYTVDEEENCLARIQEHFPDITEKEARKLIKKTNKRREDYYSFFTGKIWGDPADHDIILNIGRLGGPDRAAEMIAAIVKVEEQK